MKKLIIIMTVLVVSITTTRAQYSNATLNGAWFMYQEPLTPFGDSLMYLVFDGNGNIIDFSGVGSVIGSNYSVNVNGAVTGTLIIVGEDSFSLIGQLNSQNLGALTVDGMNYVLSRVTNPGALTDTLSGLLITNGYGQRNIMLKLNGQGEIISSSGLTTPVSGRIYTQLGVFIGHIKTGDTLDNQPWHEVGIYGYYSNDSLIGEVVVDAPQNSLRIGPANLKRSGIATPTGAKKLESNSNNVLFYPNPTADVVTLKVDHLNHSNLTVNIYNLTGALVKSEKLHQNTQQINVYDLVNGIYMVEIKSEEWTDVKKLIIHR